MRINATYAVTRPDDPFTVEMSGTEADIPIIRFGAEHGPQVEVTVNSLTLSPAEQRAWLSRLAHQIEILAAAVVVDEAEAVAS